MDALLDKFKIRLLEYCKSHSNAKVYQRVKKSYWAGMKITFLVSFIIGVLVSLFTILIDRTVVMVSEIAVSSVFLSFALGVIIISAWILFVRCSVSKHNPMREYILFYKWFYSKDTNKEWYAGEEIEESAVIKKTSSKKVNKKPPKVVQPQKPNKTEKTSKVNK